MLVDSFLHFCSVVLVLTFRQRQRQGTHQKSNYQAAGKGKMTPWTLRTHTSSDFCIRDQHRMQLLYCSFHYSDLIIG